MISVQERLAQLRNYRTWDPSKRKPKTFSGWLKTARGREAVRDSVARSERSSDPDLDFRGWVPNWQPGLPWMTGSGRAAAWCHIVYEQYSLIARELHKCLGWSGERVRSAAKALQAGMDGGGHDWVPPIDFVPLNELLRISSLSHNRAYEWLGQSDNVNPVEVRRQQWRLWISRVAGPAWGDFVLAHMIAELKREPNKLCSSMIIGEISRLRGSTATDFRGCSGCQYVARVHTLSEETKDWLMSRAPKVTHYKVNTLDAVFVPFGLAAPAEFDHCLVLGLSAEVRVRSVEFKALDASKRLALLGVTQ